MTEQANKTVLVVDDDQTILVLVKKILGNEGYKVVTTKDGRDAMNQIKNVQPQLVILDIMMPEINGYDICRTIKFDSPYKDIPVILLTSRDQEIDQRIGQMMGIEYIRKPFEQQAFLAKVKAILK